MIRLFILLLAIPCIASARLRVAVIDSGVDTTLTDAPLCRPVNPIAAVNKHGTTVVSLIAKNAGQADYCIESYRILTPKFNPNAYMWTLKHLVDNPPDVLNLSIEGSQYMVAEALLIKKLLDEGVIIIAAAGNHAQIMNKESCNTYPACDDPRIVVVGTDKPSSNRGDRINIKAHYDKGCIGKYCMSGTSQATAIETGRFIHFLQVHNGI
jgi:Subtilase family